VAIGLRRLGMASCFVGTLSRDPFGQRLRELLMAEGVPRLPEEPVDAPTRLAVIDPTNPAAPFHFYGDDPADAQLSVEHVDAAFDAASLSGLYVGSLPLTHPRMRRTVEYAINLAGEAGLPVYSDPNPRPAAWPSRAEMTTATEYLLERSRIAKLSADDAAALGWPVEPGDLLVWARERFAARLFVTSGAEGSYALVDGRPERVLARAVVPIDPTGAGDAAFAALISRVHGKGKIEREDLEFASLVGALATQRPGAVSGLPTLTEVRAASGT
jgi:sugar/nucleoside kinase (ribokinase family)